MKISDFGVIHTKRMKKICAVEKKKRNGPGGFISGYSKMCVR